MNKPVRVLDIHDSDLGNAERFKDIARGKLLFCRETSKWLAWDGRRWSVNSTGILKECIDRVILGLHGNQANARAIAHAFRSEHKSRIEAMIHLAKMGTDITVSMNHLDSDHWFLNCGNGVIDLRTGTLKDHDRRQLLTKVIDVDYHPGAPCDRWRSFLDDIMVGRSDLIRFLHKAIGYSLTGLNDEQCIFIMYGEGSNGKSTFLEVVRHVTGDYARTTEPGTLMIQRSGSIRNDIARLKGARFVSAVETGRHGKVDEVMVKQLTGKDTIMARFLYQEPFEFKPTWKTFLSTNHKPDIDGIDYAIWRRIKLIPFDATFKGDKVIKNMESLLIAEAEGILAWAVGGCLLWQNDGLETPSDIEKATRVYQEEMDTLGPFIMDSCFTHPEATVSVSGLYQTYLDWCKSNFEKPIKKREFGQLLQRRSKGHITQARTGKSRLWKGMGLTVKVNLMKMVDEEE